MMKIFLLAVLFPIAAISQTNFFPKLVGADGGLLLTNAEFRSSVGRKVIFKQRETGHLKAFDIESFSPETLAALKINTSAALEQQKEIDEENARAAQVRAEQSAIAAERLRVQTALVIKANEEQKKIAAEQAVRDEAQRKADELHRLEVQRQKANIEETRAFTRSLDRNP